MTEHDDSDLERRVRASLDRHAEEVDTTAPVAARARDAARRRPTGWIALGAAAAVAAVAVTVAAVHQPDDDATAPPVATPPSTQPAVPAGWRTEYWDDLSIAVPADWGWDAAPTSVDADDPAPYLCGGPGTMRTPDGRGEVNADASAAYVGRPVMLSDVCMGGTVRDPEAPYVWLGSALPVGTDDVGNGFTQETVQVGRSRVTVATDDPALRRKILGTVGTGELCAGSLDAPPRITATEDRTRRAADALTVCAYKSDGDGAYTLVYGDVLGADAAATTEDRIRSAPALTGDCLSPQGGEWVVLSATGQSGWSREYVVDLTCPGVTDPTGTMHRLTPAMVRPWAVDGLPVTLHAPAGGAGGWAGTFIGMLG